MKPRMPEAVLFDYGGVIADVIPEDGGFAVVAAHLANLIGDAIPVSDVESDLRAGSHAYESWKQSQSRRMHPREISHADFWELVTCNWPAEPRDAVLTDQSALATLCELFERATLHRPARPDSRATLLALRERDIRTAMVCNCLSGAAARRQLSEDGLSGLFDAELFSDEVGLRKPDTDFISQAVRAVDADPARTWFVGDKLNRDILGARRAHLAAAVLMRTSGGPGAPVRGIQPDIQIDSLTELLALLG